MPDTRRERDGSVSCVKIEPFRYRGRRLELRFAEVEGRLACIGLEIGPPLHADKNAFDGVADEDLRPLRTAETRIPLRDLVDRALETKWVSVAPLPDEDLYTLGRHVVTLADRTIADRKKKMGRPPLYERDHYEDVARIYREHLDRGGRAPTKAVAEALANGSKSTAAKWVARARADGLLPTYEGKS
jgi:hypothetical protein